ncbi:MAG: translation initiation factor IF-2 [Kiritimatiellia bacterium]|jgi:translation initiation factor IF-2
MRVVELAKSLNISVREVIRHAEALDLDARTALSTLEPAAAAQIRASLKKESPVSLASAEAKRKEALAAKRAKAEALRSAGMEEEHRKLQAAIDFSRRLEKDAKGEAEAEVPPPSASPAEAGTEDRAAEKALTPEEAAAAALAAELTAAVQSGPGVPPSLRDTLPEPVEDADDQEEVEEEDDDEMVEDDRPRKKFHRAERDEDEELEEAYMGRGSRPAPTMRQGTKQTRPGASAGASSDRGGQRSGTRGTLGRSAPQAPARPGKRGGKGAAPGRPGQQRPDPRAVRTQSGHRSFSTIANYGDTAPKAPAAPVSAERVLSLRGPISIKDLAELMGLRPNKLIADLMQWNMLASINQRIELEMAGRLADKYGYKVELDRQRRSNERRPVLKSADADDDIPEDAPEQMRPRPPIVTFLGHVDHGKTSLLDRIRKTSVTEGEAGGITQHIGAYTVELQGRKITFLDTPGHAAFSAMRARGANLTDIAVIIIAADDGIMPQTREAIRHARQANVQIMVAINKCDKPEAQPDRVRQQLQGEGLTPDTWGGDIVCAEVSAQTGQGIDNLLEMILLQADILELRANPSRRADGYVIESQLELGRGPTASLLVMGGTLEVGDVVLCGEHFGRVRGLTSDRGRRVKSAGPGIAVRVMGLSGVPEPGAAFRVMLNEKRARELAAQAREERKEIELAAPKTVSLDAMLQMTAEADKPELALVVKADTQGSVEAIVDSLKDIRSEKVGLKVIYSAIGNINNNDIQRAAAGNALIVGFQVGHESGVLAQARHDHVRIQTYRIIYDLLDNVKKEMLNLLPPEYKEVVRGHAEIRMVFGMSGKKGKVAGCQLTDGVIRTSDARVRVLRGREKIFDGRILSLHHFQDEVQEVKDLQECGIRFDGFDAFAEGDTVECYSLVELERTL